MWIDEARDLYEAAGVYIERKNVLKEVNQVKPHLLPRYYIVVYERYPMIREGYVRFAGPQAPKACICLSITTPTVVQLRLLHHI